MTVAYQADADLNEIIVKGVLRREPGIDFQSAYSAGLRGLPDLEVLAIAAVGGRILVTHDRKTMPGHFAEFLKSGSSAGVLVVPQSLTVARAINDLILIWAASEAEEWQNSITMLPL